MHTKYYVLWRKYLFKKLLQLQTDDLIENEQITADIFRFLSVRYESYFFQLKLYYFTLQQSD